MRVTQTDADDSLITPAMLLILATAAAVGVGPTRLQASDKGLPAAIAKAPKNTWVKLESGGDKIATYAAPTFVPGRGALLQWQIGAKAIKAFSATTGSWAAEAPDPSGVDPNALIAAMTKQKKFGWRAANLLKGGKYQAVMDAPVWDGKRKRIVYTANRFMAAYDPATKKWEDLKARTVINGRTYPGGPPVFGAGACYDPVNDEIVLFPHFTFHSREGRHSPKNFDRRDVDGRISNHLGTLRFSFEDKTWRRVSDTFGNPEVRKARKVLLAIMKAVSAASDAAYGLRRGKGTVAPDKVAAAFAKAGEDLKAVAVPEVAKEKISRAATELAAAIAAAKQRNWGETVAASGRALWVLNEEVIDGKLRVEPPPRCATALVFHPEKKCIVVFGGRDGRVRNDLHGPGGGPGSLDDTWLYDCTTRQWRELHCPGGPPAQSRARLFYDPVTKKIFLVNFVYNWKTRRPPFDAGVWSLDIDAAKWSQCLALKWNAQLNTRDERYEVGFDLKRSLLVFTQSVGKGKQEVHCMRLDLANAPVKPAPQHRPRTPVKRQIVPPDDPAWVEKLKALPANTWVLAKPPRECGRRDWGSVACDPVRGHVYYFGGGHSTYQINDVAIYAVGANRWSFAAGDHNDLLPPTHWGGCAMGYRGGKWAHHQRNQYVALDGRMFVSVDPPWFYDLDRGGVWRQFALAGRKKEKEAVNESAVHVVSPDGRVMAMLGQNMISRMGKPHPGRSGFSAYDIYANTLEIRNATAPFPSHVYEHRPLCFLPDRNQIFFYEHAGDREKLNSQRTWVFDIKTCKWIDLKPKNQPFKGPGGVILAEYIQDQKAIWCVLRNRKMKKRMEYWVYSFERNAWACMTENGASIGSPYGQAAYVAKYGVLVAVPKRTRVMRPDFSKLKWE